jgi:hypothetical protein
MYELGLIGNVGDSCERALAEAVIGLFRSGG